MNCLCYFSRDSLQRGSEEYLLEVEVLGEDGGLLGVAPNFIFFEGDACIVNRLK